ncbi:DUF4347 domain-containing protein [Desulfonema magnum]|uniref:Cadherin domain-containing protein, DUF4347 n=1 Tax=Desulfonema magnum TaxID=45655 RepID=A0A975BLU0_9BACT|nr:DUF4347 domain-containing protein [Desulfonema magnum]QTA87848.1 Cadherin domain-containing protein, DUF4347 [Desulfonema magnum]
MFNLRRLEDRIVLDGAGALEAIDEMHEQEEHELQMRFHAMQDHNVDDWDYGLDMDDHLYLTDGLDVDDAADGGVHVLVISSDIGDADDLADAAKDDVLVVRYDASATSMEELSEKIQEKLGGQKADSIAFAAHNSGSAQMNLIEGEAVTADSLENSEDQQAFWKAVGESLSENGRIDLLACNVLENPDDGLALVSRIEDIAGANVAASADATGNDAYGGDWVLESDNIDIRGDYFDEGKLEKFDGVMSDLPPEAGPNFSQLSVMQYATEGEEFVFTIPKDAIVDPEGDMWGYWSYDYQMPDWMTFEQEGMTYKGTPEGYDDVNNGDPSTVTIIALDGEFNAFTAEFQVTVNNVNDYPVVDNAIVSPTDPIPQDAETWEFTVSADTFSDPDNNPLTPQAGLTYSLQDNPSWMRVSTNADGSIKIDKDPNASIPQEDVKTWEVKLVATDSSGAGTAALFTVTVEDANEAPEANPNVLLDPPDAVEGQSWSYQIPEDAFLDPEGKDLWGYWSYDYQMPDGMTFDHASSTYTWDDPKLPAAGDSHTITVIALDDGFKAATAEFYLTVNDINNPPEVVSPIADIIVPQLEETTFDITDNFFDPDGDDLSYYAELTDPDGKVTHLDNENYWIYLDPAGTFTIDPDKVPDYTETTITESPWTVEVWAYDESEYAESDRISFEVTVEDHNDAPEVGDVPLETWYITQGETLRYTIPDGAFVDPEGRPLWGYWSYDYQMPEGMTLIDSTNGIYEFTPSLDDDTGIIGTHTVTVIALDDEFQAVTGEFQVVVADKPDFAPEIHEIDGDHLTYTERADTAQFVDSAGGDPIAYNVLDSDYKVLLTDDSASVTDVDSDNFEGGQLIVEILNADAEEDKLGVLHEGDGGGQIGIFSDEFVTYDGEQIASVTGVGTGTLTFNLTAAADTEAVSELIQNVTYWNADTVSPTEGDRTVKFSMTDGDGSSVTSSEQSMTLTVEAVNSPPVVENLAELEAWVTPYPENSGPFPVIPEGFDFQLTDDAGEDANWNGGKVVVEIEDGFRHDDRLFVADGAPEIGSESISTYKSTLTLYINQDANTDEVENWIKSVMFEADDEIEGFRKVTITITDPGGAEIKIDPGFDVSATNDPPVLAGIEGDTQSYSERSDPVLLESGDASVADVDSPDFDGGYLRVKITNDSLVIGEDMLSIRNEGNLSGEISVSGNDIFYGGSPFGSFTYADDQGLLEVNLRNYTADTAAVSALIHNIQYENLNTVDPTAGERNIEFQLSDGDRNDTPHSATSNIETLKVTVVPVNDAPVIENLDAALTYVEGGGDLILEPDSNVTITDVDSPNFSEGKLTLTITGGDPDEDVLKIITSDDISSTPSGITYQGEVIAPSTVFDQDAGVFEFNFSSDKATPEAVEALIETIAYKNTDSENPTTGTRTIEFKLDDGHGGTSEGSVVTVTVGGDNDAPVIDNVEGSVTYTEYDNYDYDLNQLSTTGHEPLYNLPLVALTASVTDVDSDNFGGGRLEVEIFNNLESDEDVLAVSDLYGPAEYSRLGVDDSGQVTYGFTPIGDANYEADSGLLTVTLNDTADTTSVSRLIQSITYANTNSDNPVDSDRSVRFTLWDGDGGSAAYQYVTVNVEPVNDAPIIHELQDDSSVYTEDGDPVLLDLSPPLAYAEDVDSPNFSGGQLMVQVTDAAVNTEDMLGIRTEGDIFADASAVLYDDTLIGWHSYDSASGMLTVTLNADADAGAVSALIRNIEYYNSNSADPTEGTRTVEFTLTDGDGGTSDVRQTFVTVGADNDAPVIQNLDGDFLPYEETDGAMVLDQSTLALVVDADDGTALSFEGGHLTVEITAGGDTAEDVLGIATASDSAIQVFGNKFVTYNDDQIGVATFDPATGKLDIALESGADISNVSELIQSITYNNTDSYDPTDGVRTIRFSLSDSADVSNDYFVTVDVNSPNDAPVIEHIAGDTAVFVEDADPLVLDVDPTVAFVSDVDNPNFDGGYLKISIDPSDFQSSQDVLGIASAGDITYDNGINVLYKGVNIGTTDLAESGSVLNVSLTGDATRDALSALVQSITYQNVETGNPVAGDRTISFMMSDGEASNNTSAIYEMTVTVQGTNDMPQIANLDGDAATFTEDQDTAGVILDANTNALVSDADQTDFDGGHLLVEITGGDTNEDVLGISAGYGALSIGTQTFDKSLGVLDIALNADADASDVSVLIQNIIYNNSDSDNPTLGERTVKFTLSDGDGATSPEYLTTVTVEDTNDAPVLADVEASVTYTEGAAALVVDSAVSLSDVDSPNFDGGGITVEVIGGDLTEDVLGIQSAGPIGVDGNNISYNGTPIATFNYNTGILNIDLLGDAADTVAVKSLIEHVTYENSDTDMPTEGNRTLRFAVFDGDGGSSSYNFATVGVWGLNDPPVITNLNGDAVTFNEGNGTTSSAVLLDVNGNALVSDADSTDFNGGTLTVTVMGDGSLEDMLTIRNEGVLDGQIGYSAADGSISYEGDLIGTVTASGNSLTVQFNSEDADPEAVSALIQNIQFYNSNSLNPTEGDRTVRFQLVDGDGTAWNGLGDDSSEYSDVLVTVNDMNDAPVIHELQGDSVVYSEGQEFVRLDAVGTAAWVEDLDSSNFDGGRLTIEIVGGYESDEDVLKLVDKDGGLGTGAGQIGVHGNAITYEGEQIGAGSFDADTGLFNILLYDDADTVSVGELVQSITYTNTDTIHPTAGQRTIRFALYDGNLNKSEDYDVTVMVQDKNDAPVIHEITGDVLNYTEQYKATDGSIVGGGVALLDQVPTSAFVTDTDSDDFNGGGLRVEIAGVTGTDFDVTEEVLSIMNVGNNTGEIGYNGGVVTFEGDTIGTAAFVQDVGNSMGVLSIGFNSAEADTEAVSALLRSITYNHTDSDAPSGGDRTVRFVLYDGDGASTTTWKDSSEAAIMTVKVTPVNESPEIQNIGGDYVDYKESIVLDSAVYGDTLAAGESNAANLDIGANAFVTDVDSTDFITGTLTVEFDTDAFYAGQDQLGIRDSWYTDPGSISAVAGGGNVDYDGVTFGTWGRDTAGTLTVEFTGTGATPDVVSALLQHITYENLLLTTGATEGERTIRFSLYDGDYVAYPDQGTSLFHDVTVNVTTDQNDPPVIGALHDQSVTFTEESGPVMLAENVAADVTDFDSLDFKGGHLKFEIVADTDTSGYQNTEDVLGITDQGSTGINYDEVTGDVTYQGSLIGTSVGFNAGTGILDITLTEYANETTVAALINATYFDNTNTADPTEGFRSVRFTMSDGDGGFAPTGSDFFATVPTGAADSYVMSVFVSGVNDTPEIHWIDGDYVSFSEAGTSPAEAILSGKLLDQWGIASLTDPDDPDDFTGGWLDIQVGGDNAESDADWLGFQSSTGGITFDTDMGTGTGSYSAQTVAYDGTVIGTVDWSTSSSTLHIDFNTSSNTDRVSELLQSIMYANIDTAAPKPGERTVRFQFYDGDGDNGTSNAAIMTVNVTGDNDAPEIHDWNTALQTFTDYTGLGNSGVYLESDGYQVKLQSGATISDVDVNIASGGWEPFNDFDGGLLTISMTDNFVATEDVLGISEGNGITLSGNIVMYNGEQLGYSSFNNGVLTIDINSDDTTVSNESGVSTLLRQITYSNTNTNNPMPGERTIRFNFRDGDGGTTGWNAYAGSDLKSAQMTVTVSGVNDAPEIHNLDSDVAVFADAATDVQFVLDTEGHASVEDVDGFDKSRLGVTGAVLTIDMDSDSTDTAEDYLSFSTDTGDNISFTGETGTWASPTGYITHSDLAGAIASYSWDDQSDILTITVTNSSATEDQVSEVLRSITYVNQATDGITDGDRTIRFNLTDPDGTDFGGKDSSGWSVMTLNVGGANDAPVINQLNADTNLGYLEDSTSFGLPVLLDDAATTAYVTDADIADNSNFDGGRLEVQIIGGTDSYYADEDILAISDKGSITFSAGHVYYDSTSDVGTVSWNDANGMLTIDFLEDANTTTVSALLESIVYNNEDSEDPTSGDRTIRFAMWDGDGGSSDYVSVTVGVTAVNDAPEIFSLADNGVIFREGMDTTLGVALDVSSDATVEDVDSDYFSSLKVEFTDTVYSDQDHLSIRHEGAGIEQVGFVGSNVSYEGELIGTVDLADIGSTDLTITFNQNADAEAVSALIQNVIYYNDSDGPTVGERSIRFTLTDYGDGTEVAGIDTLPSDATSSSYSTTVIVEDVNDPPVIHDLDGDLVTFNESAGAGAATSNKVILDAGSSDVSVTDADSTEFDGGKLTVKILGGDLTEDVIGFSDNFTFTEVTAIGTENIYGTVGVDAATQLGSYTWNQASGLLTIDLNSNATPDNVDDLIHGISYYNKDTVDPTAGERTVRFQLWDGDPVGPGASSNIADVKLTVNATNDAPVIQGIHGDSVIYVEESAPAVLDQVGSMGSTIFALGSVTDADSDDFDGGRLKVQISGGGEAKDVLGIRDEGFAAGQIGVQNGYNVLYEGLPIGTFTYDEMSVLDVELNDNADAEAVSALVQNITFSSTNTADLDEAQRTIRFALWDSQGDSVTAASEMTVFVKPVNDAPVIQNIAGDVVTYYEAGDTTTKKELDIGQNAFVTDPDDASAFSVFNTASSPHLYVEIMSGFGDSTAEDVLTMAALAGVSSTYDAAEHRLDITFSAEETYADVNTVLQSITYTNTDSVNPTEGDRLVRFWMDDNDGTERGGVESSANYDMTVTVVGVNDAPELTGTEESTLYWENNSADQVILGTDFAVKDADSMNFDGGRLEVQILNTGVFDKTEDVLSIADLGYSEAAWADGDTAAGNITFVDNNNVFYANSSKIGAVTYDANIGKLTIELTEHANTTTVSDLMKNITYANTDSDNPTPGDRKIQFTLFDGDGTANDGADSASLVATVQVTAVNDAPEIFNIDTDVAAFKEGGGAILLDQGEDGWARDVDNNNFSTLVVSITENVDTNGDMLSIRHEGNHWDEIGFNTTSGVVSYGTATIGTATGFDSTQLTITFNGNENSDAVATLIQNITFNNEDDNLNTDDRTIQFALSDFETTGVANMKVTVEEVNDAPEISGLGGIVGYTEGQAAPTILDDNVISITDDDSLNFEGGHLKVQITNPDSAEDRLWINTADANISIDASNNVFFSGSHIGTAQFNSASGLLDVTLTQYAETAGVKELIEAVTYENTNTGDPADHDRLVAFTLDDGDGGTSTAHYVTVQVTPVNDAPAVYNLIGDSVTYVEGADPVLIDQNQDGYAIDVDNSNFAGGYLAFDVQGATDEDMLSIQNQGTAAGQVSFTDLGNNKGAVFYEGEQIGTSAFVVGGDGPNQNRLTIGLNANADTEAVNALIKSVTYENLNTVNPTEGDRQIDYILSDGESQAFKDNAMTVTVQDVNDGPVIHDLDGDKLTYTEQDGTKVLDAENYYLKGASVTDPDSTTFNGGRLFVDITGDYDQDEDKLSIGNVKNITFSGTSGDIVAYNNKTIGTATWIDDLGRLKIEFTTDDANTESVGALLEAITYENTDTISPTEGDRTIRFMMWDGEDNPDPVFGASSDYNYVTVSVEDVNTPPVINNIQGDSVTYSEGGAAVLVDQNANAFVTDLDSPDFDGGRLEVQITNGLAGEDMLGVKAEGQLAVEDGIFVNYAGNLIATMNFDADSTTLGFDLRADADTIGVSALIQSITYTNRSEDDPTAGNRTVEFTLWDGDERPNASTPVQMTVGVVAVNDAPEIHNIEGDQLIYTEGDKVKILDQGTLATVSDPDTPIFNTGTLEVQIVSGFNPDDSNEDKLGIRSDGDGLGQISVDGNDIKYGGTEIGKVTSSDTHKLVITLDDDANHGAVAALIQNITYENTDTNSPYEGERAIQFKLSDGDVNPATSDAYTMTVTVNGVNDAPVIDTTTLGGERTTFYEANGDVDDAVILDTDENASVTDPDGGEDFKNGKLTVQIGEGYDPDEDILSVRNEGNGFHQIGFDVANNVFFEGEQIGKAEFIESSGLLEISLNDNAKIDNVAVSSLIQNIRYNNMDTDNPTEGERTVSFTVWDADGASSSTRDTFVDVRDVNDAPVIHNIGGDTMSYEEGEGPKVLDVGLNGYVTDVDTTEFSLGTLHVDLTVLDTDPANSNTPLEMLNINNEGSGAGQISFAGFDEHGPKSADVFFDGVKIGVAEQSYGGLEIAFNDQADEDAVSALIQNITYENTDTVNPVEGDRTIRFRMSDGFGNSADPVPDRSWMSDAFSDWYEATVNVQGVNDAPEIHDLDGETLTYYKNEGMQALDQGTDAFVTDIDSTDFAGGQLSVQIVGGGVQTEDVLGISTSVAGQNISLAGDEVFYNGQQIGTYELSSDKDTLTIDFNDALNDGTGATHTEAVSALIKSVGYENTSTTNPQSGERLVRFSVSDGDGGTSAYANVTVDLLGNRAPVVDEGIEDWDNLMLMGVNRFTIPNDAFTDPDLNDTLTYTAKWLDDQGTPYGDDGDLPGWLYLNKNSGEFVAEPTNVEDFAIFDGKIQIQVTATDTGGLSAETTFTIFQPENVNTAPVFTDASPGFMISEHEPAATGNTLEGQTVSDPAVVDGKPVYTSLGADTEPVKVEAVDPDGEPIQAYRITGGTGSGIFNIGEKTGEITLISTTGNPDTTADDLDFETGPKVFTLEIEAEDAAGEVGTTEVVILVSDENDLPVANDIPDQTVLASRGYWSYNLDDPKTEIGQVVAFTDPDGDTLTYRAEEQGKGTLPSWLDDFKDGWLKGDASKVTSTTTYTIELFADDGTDEVSTTFNIEVIVASLDTELRDALRYLDVEEDVYEDLPIEGEEVEVHDVLMYAEAPAEDAPADADIADALALLDGFGIEPVIHDKGGSADVVA